MAVYIPGIPKSSLPPVRVGNDLWDANSWNELKRRIEHSQKGEAKVISDEELVLELGMTSDQLIHETGLTDDEIEQEFGMNREELANSLGMPRADKRKSA